MKIKKVFLDLDGVLADFDRQLAEHDISPSLPRAQFWEAVQQVPKFWTSMWSMPGARQLVEHLRSLNIPIEILTSPAKSDPRCKPGKLTWLKAHGFDFPVHFKWAQLKHEFAQPGYVLIDDKPETIRNWNDSGGIGIRHRNLAETLSELKKYEKEDDSQMAQENLH